MKITVEVDCTPEEARRLMGIPDTAVLQQAFLGQLGNAGAKPEALEAMVKGWAPLGDVGVGLWKALVDAAVKPPEATGRDDGR